MKPWGGPLAALAAATALRLAYVQAASPAFTYEARLIASGSGKVQVYYDVGRGFNESDSSSIRVAASPRPIRIALPLPPETIRHIRFDPIDNDSVVTLLASRIAGPGGRTVLYIAPEKLKPANDIASVQIRGGAAVIRPIAGSDDPNLVLIMDRPLVLAAGWAANLAGDWLGIAETALGLWLALLAGRACWRRRSAGLAAARRHPQRTILALALAAAVAASYPVVFFGMSFVSPNMGTALVYPSPPTLPGYAELRQENVHGADVGAMMWQEVPYSAIGGRSLFHWKEWPLWNRFNSCGVTLLGQGQSMFGDPLSLPLFAAGGASWAWDVKFVAAKALFAAGIGLCAWTIAGDLWSAGLVAFAAAFVGFYNYRVSHPAYFSVSYAPWILCAWLRAASARDSVRFASALLLGFVANTAELASGAAKESFVLIAFLNLVGILAWLLIAPPAGTSRAGRAAAIAAAGACWVLATAPLWLTFGQALRTAYSVYEAPDVFQAPRAWLVGLFDDLFFRELVGINRVYTPSGNFLLLFGVLLAAANRRRLPRSGGALACAVGLAASIAIAFAFVPREWILAVPILRNVYHVDSVFSAAAIIMAAPVAAWGIADGRIRLRRPGAWKTLEFTAVSLTVLLAAYFLQTASVYNGGGGLAGWKKLLPAHLFFYANLALMAAAGGVLAFLGTRKPRAVPGIFPAAAFALSLVALLYRHGQHLPWMRVGGEYLNFPSVRADLAAPSPAVRFALASSSDPARVVGLDGVLFAGFNAVPGVEGINGPDALMNRQYRELAVAAGLAEGADWRFPCRSADADRLQPVLDFLNVRYLLGDRVSLPRSARYARVATLDLDVFASPTAWPRAFFSDRLESYADVKMLAGMIRSGDGRPFGAVQTGEADAPPPTPGNFAGRTIVAAERYRLTPNTTSFEVDSDGPGFAILSETWLPGDFRATLDGKPVPYFRVNHAFKAIAVPAAGRHRIEFAYWPQHFTLALEAGAAGFAGFAILLMGICAREIRAGKCSRDPASV